MPLTSLVGHRELVAGLESEFARRPSHAYLFAGIRGIGKATVARGFVHNVLCERSPGPGFCCDPVSCPVRNAPPTPPRSRTAVSPPRCACCAACVQIATGVHPDFIAVARNPARTELSIEQVRDLIDRLGSRPARGPRRIALIDEAETLSLPAQHALLKTLEEPPGHTIILMVTSSERALLDTVRSRMRAVRFAPLELGVIADALVAQGKATAARARAIAPLARGSLERALALAGGEEPPAHALLEALDRAALLDFATVQALAQELFAARDQAAANFELIARLLQEMLCCKLLRTEMTAPSPTDAQLMTAIAERYDAGALAQLAEAALAAAEAVAEMANSRLQAERFFMSAASTLRGE